MKICPRCKTTYEDPKDLFCTVEGARLLDAGEYKKARGDPMLGRTVAGRFEITARIGTGGMGTVYKAIQTTVDRTVALKVLNKDLADSPEVVERFRREAKAASLLQNPHTVTLFDFGQDEEDGMLFLAMELLEGESLADRIDEGGAIEWRQALSIASEIAESLIEAHESGVIHRDLKPDNIYLTASPSRRERAKVLDFGIAKLIAIEEEEEGRSITQKGAAYGTPGYMSPEQSTGYVIDHRTDLYALGAILFEMIAGKPPFDTRNPVQLISQHIGAPVPSIAERTEEAIKVPEEVDHFVRSLLEKEPEARPQTAREVAKTIEQLLELDERRPPTPIATPTPPPTTRRRPSIFLGIGATIALALVVGIWSINRGEGSMTALTDQDGGRSVMTEVDSALEAHRSRPEKTPPDAAVAPVEITLSLRATPGEARFWLDGLELEGNPYLGSFPRTTEEHQLEVKAAGFVTARQRLLFDDAIELELRLNEAPPVKNESKRSRGSSKTPQTEQILVPSAVKGLPPPDIF